MLDVESKKELREPRSFALKPSTVQLIESLAKVYDTSASRIVEAMIVQYGPKILTQMENRE